MPIEGLLDERANVVDSIKELIDQIESIKSQLRADQYERDSSLKRPTSWFRRAAYKKKRLASELAENQKRLTILNQMIKEENIKRSESKNSVFVEHAKRLLPEELFLSILDSVNREIGVAGRER